MNLAQYLVEKQISQKKLAEILEVSQPTIHKWLNNKSIPSGKMLVKIDQITGGKVGARDFVNG